MPSHQMHTLYARSFIHSNLISLRGLSVVDNSAQMHKGGWFPNKLVFTLLSTIVNFFGRNLVTEGAVLVLREYDRAKAV